MIPPRLRFALLIALGGVLSHPSALRAQFSGVTMGNFTAGSEFEDYLRAIQISGGAPLYPWSIRSFSRREVEQLVSTDSAGPWKLRDRFSKRNLAIDPLAFGTTFNSAYPYGANDGPLWAGRGLTVAVSGGVSGYLGPISFALAPMAFSAANRPFELLSNGFTGPLAFNHGTFAENVDYPQRFGSTAYSRGDPGDSYLRFDTRFVSAGISTANEWIGPATEFPFLLSNNAPGFPHLFLGSGSPLNIWLGKIHGRAMWGRLDQSAYSPVTGGVHYVPGISNGTVRLMAAAEGVFIPRGVPGLEIGVARFFHVPYAMGEPNEAFWKKPFRVFFLKNEVASGDSAGRDNQLASIFFRWVFPRAGLEVYGERGYEDQFYDFREFIMNLDHDREYMVGLQKVLRKRPDGFDVLRAEVINYQVSTLVYTRFGEGRVYLHGALAQGHTNRGQLLGAYPGVNAAAASVLSWTHYSPRKRSAFTLRRILRDQIGDFETTGITTPKGSDVIIALGAETMRYGKYLDVGGKMAAMDDLNRNFSKDIGNLNLQLTVRLHPR